MSCQYTKVPLLFAHEILFNRERSERTRKNACNRILFLVIVINELTYAQCYPNADLRVTYRNRRSSWL
jgi:hypothetical protein